MSIEIYNFYLATPMVWCNGLVHVEVRKGIYGLPQAGILVNKLLEKRLSEHEYFQNKIIPGLWTHTTRPIQFALVVGAFGVKYVKEKHAKHLMSVLQEFYVITHD